MVKNISGGIIDRFLGFLAGFLRGGLICIIAYFIIAVFSSGSYFKAQTLGDISRETTYDKYPAWLKKPFVSEYLDNASKNLTLLFPYEILDAVEIPQKSSVDDPLKIIEQTSKEKNLKSLNDEPQLDKDLENELHEVLP